MRAADSPQDGLPPDPLGETPHKAPDGLEATWSARRNLNDGTTVATVHIFPPTPHRPRKRALLMVHALNASIAAHLEHQDLQALSTILQDAADHLAATEDG